jgi:hypothetical protein
MVLVIRTLVGAGPASECPSVMQQQPIDYATDAKRKLSPARRLRLLLVIGLALAVAAFIASFVIVLIYVGGG